MKPGGWADPTWRAAGGRGAFWALGRVGSRADSRTPALGSSGLQVWWEPPAQRPQRGIGAGALGFSPAHSRPLHREPGPGFASNTKLWVHPLLEMNLG